MDSDFITTHWPLSRVNDVQIIKQSGARIVYDVFAKEGRFILKIADPSKDEEKVIKDIQVLQFLEKVRYLAPRILPTLAETPYVHLDNKFVYAMSYIDGNAPEKSAENYGQLGEVTARLHELKGYSIPTDFTTVTETSRMISRARKFDMEPLYEQLVASLPDFDSLPTCLIHTDISAHNAIKESNSEIILVDWDDAGIGTRILDIGFPLICDFVSNDLIFDEERAKAFYQSYCSIIELSETEKTQIFDAALFYAMSYTIFDDSGIVEGQWKKVLYAIKHKKAIISALPF